MVLKKSAADLIWRARKTLATGVFLALVSLNVVPEGTALVLPPPPPNIRTITAADTSNPFSIPEELSLPQTESAPTPDAQKNVASANVSNPAAFTGTINIKLTADNSFVLARIAERVIQHLPAVQSLAKVIAHAVTPELLQLVVTFLIAWIAVKAAVSLYQYVVSTLARAGI